MGKVPSSNDHMTVGKREYYRCEPTLGRGRGRGEEGGGGGGEGWACFIWAHGLSHGP